MWKAQINQEKQAERLSRVCRQVLQKTKEIFEILMSGGNKKVTHT